MQSRPAQKGRTVEPRALAEVRALLEEAHRAGGAEPRRRDLLIENLHCIQDRYGRLSAAHLAALAKELKIWARMGHPCGEDFLAEPFLEKQPEFKWQGKFLKDMKGQPWTLFAAKKLEL